MTAQHRFLFIKDFVNNYGQIVIPKGTTGTLIFDESRIYLSCDRIVKEQGTAWLTIKFEYVKDCMSIKQLD